MGLLCRLLVTGLLAVWGGAAAACPNFLFSGARIELDGARLAEGWSIRVAAGGPYRLQTCGLLLAFGHPLGGHAAAPPHVSARITGIEGRDLLLTVDSGCATGLLVNLPNQTFTFAASREGGPTLRLTGGRRGLYDIWVAAAAPGGCAATLRLEAVRPKPSADFVERLRRF
jgi:hypothetical protein